MIQMMRWHTTIGLCFWFASNALAITDFSENDIRASRVTYTAPAGAQEKTATATTPLLIVLFDTSHHLTVLDGDKLKVIHRFKHRAAIQGALQFSPDGRYVYLATRDGWVNKFDLWQFKIVAEIRAGSELQNIALSGDGKFLAVANVEPQTVVLLDADLNLQKIHAARSKDGRASSRVSGVVTAALRQSFVVALATVPEVWEISTNPTADEIPIGMVHDFQYKEGAFIPGFLNPRRSAIAAPIDDFILTPSGNELIGVNRNTNKVVVVHLDVRKQIAELTLPSAPNLSGAIVWREREASMMAVPNLKDGRVSIVDLVQWKTIKSLEMPGPGALKHAPKNNVVAWIGSELGSPRDTFGLFDKRTLEKTLEIKPASGRTVADVTFTRDGRYVLAHLSEAKNESAAIIIFDAETFKEIKRIQIEKNIGK